MVTFKVAGIAICTYLLLSSSIILVVISGIAYYYLSNDIIIFMPHFQIHILFGCGIGVGIIVFIGIWIFLFFPKIAYNFVITFPCLIILPCVYIYFSIPGSSEKFVDSWNDQWIISLDTESLQMKQSCCGWNNYTDRALEPCPMTFRSGCKNLVLAYLKPRLMQLFVTSCVALAGGAFSSTLMFTVCLLSPEHNIIEQLEIVN